MIQRIRQRDQNQQRVTLLTPDASQPLPGADHGARIPDHQRRT